MKKTYLAASTLAFLVGCGATPDGSTSEDVTQIDRQEALTSNGTYAFGTLVHSGSCMDIAAASTADGTQIQEYPCNGTAAQTFQPGALDSTYYKIVNPVSGKCLDMAANSAAKGWLSIVGCPQPCEEIRFTSLDAGKPRPHPSLHWRWLIAGDWPCLQAGSEADMNAAIGTWRRPRRQQFRCRRPPRSAISARDSARHGTSLEPVSPNETGT
jgi:hypothetical protein